MSEATLKPCPCCAFDLPDTASTKVAYHMREFSVFCPKCYMRGPWCNTPEVAAAAWNYLPRALRWAKEVPTVPGHYWWREGRNDDNLVAHVFFAASSRRNSPSLYAQFAGEETAVHDISEMGGEWAGPIPAPAEESQEAAIQVSQ